MLMQNCLCVWGGGGGGPETHQESELWEMWKWQIGKKAVYLAVHVVC